MRLRELLFQIGLILLAIVLGAVFGTFVGYIAAGVLAIAFISQRVLQKEEGQESESQGLFDGPVPWAERVVPERKPRLIWTAFQFVDAIYDKESAFWREGWHEYRRKAFVIHFANLLYDDGKGVPALKVRAQIIWQYHHGAPGPLFFPAAWIDEECGLIDIPVGFSKKLIIGMKSGSEGGYYWEGYSNPRIDGNDKHRLDGQPVPNHGTLLVKLIGATDEVWYEQKWEWEEDLQHGSHPRIRLSVDTPSGNA
jgi:hypothetical protein